MSAELWAEAVLGQDAEEFFASELGKYLAGCAEQEEKDAFEALAYVDPTEYKQITILQNRVWRARNFTGWLREIIVAGKQAKAVLESE